MYEITIRRPGSLLSLVRHEDEIDDQYLAAVIAVLDAEPCGAQVEPDLDFWGETYYCGKPSVANAYVAGPLCAEHLAEWESSEEGSRWKGRRTK